MVKEGVVKKAVFCLRSADEETRYWALAVLNELIALGGGTGHNHDENDSNDDFESTDPHAAFFESKGLSRLIELCCDDQDRPAVHVLLYAADIMVYLCGECKKKRAEE